jgi:hypothetical protein
LYHSLNILQYGSCAYATGTLKNKHQIDKGVVYVVVKPFLWLNYNAIKNPTFYKVNPYPLKSEAQPEDYILLDESLS